MICPIWRIIHAKRALEGAKIAESCSGAGDNQIIAASTAIAQAREAQNKLALIYCAQSQTKDQVLAAVRKCQVRIPARAISSR